MNCQTAQKLLSAERDETLGAEVRASLDAHVAGCDACRKLRVVLAESAAAWRVNTAAVRVPDERLEWQRLRRRLDGAADEAPAEARSAWRLFSWRGATILGAAAAVMLGFFFTPRGGEPSVVTGNAVVAVTDSVEVGSDASAAMVFVDDKSGWLVVWAAGASDGD
ncbi:MAG: zf-HC2 domain-containing protein [Verrucomicrobia bacterium]|nr:zf-HC2 domain-containing protein [Verrucomicrobiota bacterium]